MDDLDELAADVVLLVQRAIGPVLERLTAAETRLATLGDLRDRVVTVETKTAAPPAPDPTLRDLRDRLLVLETKAALVVPDPDLTAIRERMAVLETRAPVPGPAGVAGRDGKDGADGLGFDDVGVELDGDRTLAVKFIRGDRVKTFPIVLPYQRYQGVYQEGKSYDIGDGVTWGGSVWHCNEATTTKPGDGSKAWTLQVKRGRDGKDGADAPGALPVVKVR